MMMGRTWRLRRDKRGYVYAEQKYRTAKGPRTRRVYLRRGILSDAELRAKAQEIVREFGLADSPAWVEAELRAKLRLLAEETEPGASESLPVRGLVPALNYLDTYAPPDSHDARVAGEFRDKIFALVAARAQLPHRGDRPPRQGNPALDFWLALDDLTRLMHRHRVGFGVLPRYSAKTGIFLGLRFIVDTTALPASLTPVAYTLSALFDWLNRGGKPRIARCGRCSRFFSVTYRHRRLCQVCSSASAS